MKKLNFAGIANKEASGVTKTLKNENLGSESVLRSYYAQIIKVPLMDRKEEKRVALLASKGEKWAQEKMVLANLRFVVKIAKKYSNYEVPLSDLISEGNIGLMRAVKTYDPNRGPQFISYAVYWIKQSIFKYIAEKGKLVRLPSSWNNKIHEVLRLKAETKNSEKDISYNEVLEKIDFSEKKLIALQDFIQTDISLDQPISGASDYDDGGSLHALIANEKSEDPEEMLNSKFLTVQVKKAFMHLKDKEKKILEDRLGFFGERKTLEEIGKNFHLTKERIRQIEKTAYDKLRTILANYEAEAA